MRRGGKPDANQDDIIKALRDAKMEVLVISGAGFGAPDLLVQSPRHGVMLVEVKRPKGKLRPAQVAFRKLWPVAVVRTVDEAITATLGQTPPQRLREDAA